MSDLHGKNILLGVTGGIAAYKSPDLVRRLREQGANVQVVMTESAAQLVSKTVFQAVSDPENPVRDDLWDSEAEQAMGHIELARWAELILIAPATANIMSQLAAGTATGLLTTLCLASDAPLVLAPAMNQAMWRHAATQANRQTLSDRGVRFIGPAVGDQACGDQGPGRMAEPNDIVAELAEGASSETDSSANSGLLNGVRVLLTAGPTREPIDPVRFISNRSSGKMGFAVAQAAAEAGAEVVLVAGPVNLSTPTNVERIDVESAAQMYEATMAQVASVNIYIGAAAISDYRPNETAEHKIKKSAPTLTLQMTKSPDLLADIAALPSRPFTVGFAAETEKLEEHARGKLERKRLDMIVGNLVADGLCFDRDENSVLVIWPDGVEAVPRMSKIQVARKIIASVAGRYNFMRNAPTPIRRPTAS